MLNIWIAFVGVVLALVAADLFVFHRKDAVLSVRTALKWSAFWAGLALGFNVLVYFMYRDHWYGLGTHPSALHEHGLGGWEAASLFFTGYIVEQSLSMDNLFVMAAIFSYFAVPQKLQHRVLFWGIIGVLILRGVMIGLGAALIHRFHWLLYVFGVILLITAWRMIFGGGEADPKKNIFLRIAKRFFPITHDFHGHRFIVRQSEILGGEQVDLPEARQHDSADAAGVGNSTLSEVAKPKDGWVLTPLFLALVVIETTDVVFAVDSIPAIFAVTTDPFLVFTSNICAVLGLRSLFFALAGILEKFEHLKTSLAAILALVGIKMLANDWIEHIPGMNYIMLGVVSVLLAIGVVVSMVKGKTSVKVAGNRSEP